MSIAADWKTTVPHSAGQCETVERAQSPRRSHICSFVADSRNVPRYVVKYGVLALAVLGTLQLWAAKGDGPMPAFMTLSKRANLDPHRVSSPSCMAGDKSDRDRWQGLAPALAILKETNPEVARWVERTHEEGRIVFTDRRKDSGAGANSLAKFDLFQRKLRICPGIYAEPDGSVAAVLCHEYRHSRQRFPKVLNYALSFLFSKGGDPSIVENDAVIYEQEARRAIFGEVNEALDGLEVRLVAR